MAGACEWLADREASAQSQSRHPEAVNVLTYHGAKGLEWPIVVLTELESKARGNPFGVYAEQQTAPDWRDPLAGRVLRYWPWPYAAQKKDVGLDLAAVQGPEGQRTLLEERLERTRLLYVGTTRPRDQLVLAISGGTDWLDELRDDADAPVVVVGPDTLRAGVQEFPLRAPPPRLDAFEQASEREFVRPVIERQAHPPLRLRPSGD